MLPHCMFDMSRQQQCCPSAPATWLWTSRRKDANHCACKGNGGRHKAQVARICIQSLTCCCLLHTCRLTSSLNIELSSWLQGESPSAAQPSTPPSSQETQDAPMVEEPIAKPILARSRKAANSRKASPAPPLYQPSTDHARASMARASPDVHMVDAATARQPGAQQGVAAQRHGVQKEKGERLIKKQKRSSAVGQLAAQPATPSSSDGGDCAAAADAAGRAPHGVSSEAGPLSSGADDLHATHDMVRQPTSSISSHSPKSILIWSLICTPPSVSILAACGYQKVGPAKFLA